MTSMLITIITGALTTLVGAGVLALFRRLTRFESAQREANALNAESIRSMQRAELMRMFERVVEDGKPVTVEDLEHIESCYKAYHASGGNGTGTMLYNRILEHAYVVTKPRKGGEE